MSLAWTLALVLAAITPGPPGRAPIAISHPPKPVENASAKDCEVFAAVGAQREGWVKQASRIPLLIDVEEPKVIYRVNCPWGELGVKGPRAATPSDPTVFMFLRPRYVAGGNIATFWIKQQQDRFAKGGPGRSQEQFHVFKRNYGGGHVYWVVS